MTPIQIVGGGSDQALFIPAVRAFRNTNQSVAAANFTELLFDKEEFDNAEMHSTVANTGRLVAPKAGLYLVTFQYAMFQATSSTTGLNQAVIVKSGLTNVNSVRYGMEPNGEGIVQISALLKLEGGEYATCLVYNASGSARNVSTAEGTMIWVGSGLKNATQNYDWGIVTALPASAQEGDYSSLKVREGSEYPWKLWRLQKVEEGGERPWAKIGGPPLKLATANASPEFSSSTIAYTNMPTLVLPNVKMEALVEGGFIAYNRGTVLNAIYATLAKGTSSKTGIGIQGFADLVSQFDAKPAIAHSEGVVLAAGETISVGYSSISAVLGQAYNPWLEIDPVRVG